MSRLVTSPILLAEAPAPTSTPGHWLRRPADRAWSAVALVLVWCASLFFYGLTQGELYRTESLRAIVAQGFLRSGNWIVPTLYGEPLFTKPPGMYAAIALLSRPLGQVTEWTARLPSALAATITVLLVYGYFTRQLGRRGGLVAALILPASFMWLDKASAAEIDMMQLAWVTAALLCFLRALENEEARAAQNEAPPATIASWRVQLGVDGRASLVAVSPGVAAVFQQPSPAHAPRRPAVWFWWLAAFLCVAGGVLTKWTAPAFFYGTVVSLLWWRGRLRLLLSRRHLLSAALCAGVCLTWIGLAVGLTSWEVFYGTVSREALMRLLPSHHYRPYPWRETLTHPGKLLLANLPWSAYALGTLWPGFLRLWDAGARRLLQALHCWTWPNLLFWSILPEHAPRHSFPLFPGIAGLAAFVWIAWLDGKLRWPDFRWRPLARPVRVLGAFLVFWLLVKIAFVEVVIPARNQNRLPRAKGERLAALLPADQTLYLSKLKDEGILFYYGRAAQRLVSFADLPSSQGPVYCILDDSEWRHWSLPGSAQLVEHMRDEQGDPMVLIKVTPIAPATGPPAADP